MSQVNEASTAYLVVNFLDSGGSPAVPSTVDYRIDCMTTGANVRASTPLSPASPLEITLTPTDNAMQNQEDRREVRRVTVVGTYGGGDQVVGQFDYEVVGLTGYPLV